MDKVAIETQFLGGGFGRRGSADFVGEAVEISKAIGTRVKLTWTREDDIAHDTFRPASRTEFAAGLDQNGWPVALTARTACPSVQAGGGKPQGADGLDRTGVEGIFDLEYGIPNLLVDYRAALLPTQFPTGVPSVFRRTRSSWKASMMNWLPPVGRTPSTSAASCWRKTPKPAAC